MRLLAKIGIGIGGAALAIGGVASYAAATEQQDDGGGSVSLPLSANVVTSRYSEYETVSANASDVGFDVHCGDGQRVTGGGFYIDPASGVQLISSGPGAAGDPSAEAWRIYVNNTTGDDQYIYVYAVCIGSN